MDVSGALFCSEEGRGRLGRKSAARDAWRAGGGEVGCEFGEDLQKQTLMILLRIAERDW